MTGLQIVGHDAVWARLTAESPFAALLFAGPSGVGKRRMALQVAAYWNCSQVETCWSHSPANRCWSCQRILNLGHPDVRLWQREEGKLSLGIGEMRELISSSASVNYEAKLRFDLIDDAHLLTDEAQTSILKTLEEPGRRQILVLITDQPKALLDTVRSRCSLVRFEPLSVEQVQRQLEERGTDRERAAVVAHLCQGRLGAALRMMEQPQQWAAQEELLDQVLSLPGKGLWSSLEVAKALESIKLQSEETAATAFAASRMAAEAQLDLIAVLLRDLMSLTMAGPSVVLAHREEQLKALANRLDRNQLWGLFSKLHQAQLSLQSNVSPRFVWQNLCINLATDLCLSSR